MRFKRGLSLVRVLYYPHSQTRVNSHFRRFCVFVPILRGLRGVWLEMTVYSHKVDMWQISGVYGYISAFAPCRSFDVIAAHLYFSALVL